MPYSPARVKDGEAIVPNVIKAVEVARSRFIPIIWVTFCFLYMLNLTMFLVTKNDVFKLCIEIEIVWLMKVVREHDPLGRDVELFRRHFYAGDKPKLVVKGSTGAELVEGLEIKSHDYKLVKT